MNAARRLSQSPFRLIAGAGGLVFLLGLAFLAGWALRVPALVSGQPGIDTIPPSGALGFLLCGAGLAAAALRGDRWAILCGGGAALLGGTNLVGHLVGAGSVLDSLLFRFLQLQTQFSSGGMPPGGAIAFLVAGVGIVSAASPLFAQWRFLLLCSEGAVVAFTGVLARIGYIDQAGGSWDTSFLPGMPAFASLSFLLVGGGIAGLGVIGTNASPSLGQASASGQLKSRVPFKRAGFVLPLLGTALLLGSIGVFLVGLRHTQQADRAVRHTLNVIIALSRIETSAVNMQSGMRGYVITGQEGFLAPYHAGGKDFTEAYDTVKRLTGDNPVQQRHLEKVRSLDMQWNEYAANVIALQKGAAGASRARKLVASGLGNTLMSSLRDELKLATDLEFRLLAERVSRASATRAVLTIALLFCVVGGILAGMTQFLLARRLESQRRILVSETASRAAAELRFRQLVELAPHAMVIVNPEGSILLVNSQVLSWFRYSREELVGQPVEILIPERFRRRHPAYLSGFVRAPTARPMGTGRDLYGLRKDGTEFPVDISLSPVDTAQGLQVIAAISDMTERRHAEENLKRANLAYEAVNKELEAFAYSVSHDLRAPIRGMAGFSQILIEDFGPQLPQEAREHLRVIQAEGQRMGQLIDDMLNLSRVTRVDLCREPVNLSALAAEVLAALRKAEPERQAEFIVADGLTVSGDARLLRILLDNLLGNAWKFTGRTAQPRIEFGAVSGNGGSAFFVRDNGAGFDMAYADKLFGAFQRLHRAEEFPGTGIGLAIVHRIVTRHGGRVWAESIKGQGATFHFSL